MLDRRERGNGSPGEPPLKPLESMGHLRNLLILNKRTLPLTTRLTATYNQPLVRERNLMEEAESLESPEKVCSTCLGDNLLRDIGIKKCARCCEPFCIHHASIYDSVYYCTYCLHDITLTRTVLSKTSEVRDCETGELLDTFRRKAVSTTLGGLDWLFIQRLNQTLTDAELATKYEYFRQNISQLLTDIDKRRAEKAHKLAAKKIHLASPSGVSVTHTESKKTTTIKAAPKPPANGSKKVDEINSLLNLLLGGMSPEEIQKALKGRKG